MLATWTCWESTQAFLSHVVSKNHDQSPCLVISCCTASPAPWSSVGLAPWQLGIIVSVVLWDGSLNNSFWSTVYYIIYDAGEIISNMFLNKLGICACNQVFTALTTLLRTRHKNEQPEFQTQICWCWCLVLGRWLYNTKLTHQYPFLRMLWIRTCLLEQEPSTEPFARVLLHHNHHI